MPFRQLFLRYKREEALLSKMCDFFMFYYSLKQISTCKQQNEILLIYHNNTIKCSKTKLKNNKTQQQ